MAEYPLIGEIMAWPIYYAPRGWALCDGSLLSIYQNTALFALLGTTYGGDGQSTFALPDLRGRALVGAGTGTGLTPRDLGDRSGGEKAVFSITNLPELTGDPVSSVLSLPAGQDSINIMPPCLALNYIIAIDGMFPIQSW